MNASRICTVSAARKSTKLTVSVSFPRPGSGVGEMVPWQSSQPAQTRRVGSPYYPALTELPASTWKGWRALLLCLVAPLIPKMITALIMILIGGKGMLHALRQSHESYSELYPIVCIQVVIVLRMKLRVTLWPSLCLLLIATLSFGWHY